MRRGIPRVFSEFCINVLEQSGEGGGGDWTHRDPLL